VCPGAGLSCCVRDAGRGAGGRFTCDLLFVPQKGEEDQRLSKEVKRGSRRKRTKALEFKYAELINIADELSWFPPKRITWGKRTTLAGFAHELRKLRNYVHPGVWAPERPQTMKFTKGVYDVAYEILDVANSWLIHRVEESLKKRTKREGLL